VIRPAKAHVFVDDLARPELDRADHHHLDRVLRLRPGDGITVGDGAGRWRACRLGAGGALAVEGEVVAEPRPQPPVAIAFAVTKGDRPEWTVQKLTEVGVDRIVPFVAERSIVRWDEQRAVTHSDRWRRIAREAACQCRRAWLPDVENLTRFADVMNRPGAALAHPGGRRPSMEHGLLLIGPEGGWSEVVLGAHVLRAETAALVGGALLCGLREGVVLPAG
jgi:16S rRNA (uracil1498-N3)-methyltransferase